MGYPVVRQAGTAICRSAGVGFVNKVEHQAMHVEVAFCGDLEPVSFVYWAQTETLSKMSGELKR